MILTGGFLNYTRWLKDGSAQITVETNELPPNIKRDLGGLGGEFVYFAIKREPFTGNELGNIDKLMSKPPKSKSLKLRQITYRLWEQMVEEGMESREFEDFYADRMDEFIRQIKEML